MKRNRDEDSPENAEQDPTPQPPPPPETLIQRPPPTAVYGRVKVKLKTAAPPKPPVTEVVGSTESQLQSDGGKIVSDGRKVDDEVVVGGGGDHKVEDNGKKIGGIKIVSSKNFSPLGGKEGGGGGGGGGGEILRNASAVGGEEGGGKVEDSSKKIGGIKIVSSKNSSPLGGNGGGGGGGVGGEILRNTSPVGGEEIGGKVGIKIVSSKNSSPLVGKESNGGGEILRNVGPVSGEESGGKVLMEEEKKVEEKEWRVPPREVKYNQRELEASLEVIKKIMKMDAAEPFNVPVDPIALGIPDYFDVIDTPMDFGTIRKNLEGGIKYMDSEDVYKDVQFIWDNCYKYNNKGDYIVDLMKRVKKNFMKYWMAAGLYTEQSYKITDGESSPVNEPATTGFGKKLKKGRGFKRHKDDCLCAICIMKRKRREREAREAKLALEAGGQTSSPHIKLPKIGLTEGYKQEIVRVGSPVEETSSYMETSLDGDDVEMEDGEMRPDASVYESDHRSEVDRADLRDKSDRSRDLEKLVQSDKGDLELYSRGEAKVQDDSGSKMKIDSQEQPSIQPEPQNAGYMQQRNEMLELEKKRQKQRMLETFRDLENPMLLGLCGMLFPNKAQSVWNGANSLIRCKRSFKRGDIHEAVASFTNPPFKSAK